MDENVVRQTSQTSDLNSKLKNNQRIIYTLIAIIVIMIIAFIIFVISTNGGNNDNDSNNQVTPTLSDENINDFEEY